MADLRTEIEAFCGCENDCDYFEDREGKFGVPCVGMRTNKDLNSITEMTEYLIDAGFKNINQILGDIRFIVTENDTKNEIYYTGVRPE